MGVLFPAFGGVADVGLLLLFAARACAGGGFREKTTARAYTILDYYISTDTTPRRVRKILAHKANLGSGVLP